MAIVTGQPGLAQQDQRPGALELDVVGMGMQGQDAERRSAMSGPSQGFGWSLIEMLMSSLAGGKTQAVCRVPIRWPAGSTENSEIFRKMFSRALADRCTLATKESVT